MAEFYVAGSGSNSSGNGSSANPWRTLSFAHGHASVGANDTIWMRNGTYHEVVKLTKAGIKVRAAAGHTPILDGEWREEFSSCGGAGCWQGKQLPAWDAKSNYLPGSETGAMIEPNANDCLIEGLTFIDVAGQAISGGKNMGERVHIIGNKIDRCYDSGISLAGGQENNPAIKSPEVGYNLLSRCALKIYVPDRLTRGQGGGQQVSGTLKVGGARDAWIHHNSLAFGYGEGINPGKYNIDCIVEYNTSHTHNHGCINANRSDNTIIRYNLLFHTADPRHLSTDNDIPAGIVFSDEYAGNSPIHSRYGAIHSNLIICKKGIDYRNGSGSQYDMQLDNHYCGFNTIVVPAWMDLGGSVPRGMKFDENQHGRLHKNSVCENNLIQVQPSQNSRIATSNGGLNGVLFRNNCWSALPPNNMRGSNDQTGDAKLVNPFVRITGNETGSPNATNININNYRLTSSSTLCINKGISLTPAGANGMTRPSISTDFYGGARVFGSAPDIGAHEFGASVSTIVASFTQNGSTAAISGQEPYSVSFVDTSSGTPTSWLWQFSDGNTSTAQNPTHSFAAGTWTATLTVTNAAGQSSQVTGNTITVSGDATDIDCIVDVDRVGARTTTGTQNRTAALSGQIGKASLFFYTNAVSNGVAANGLMLGVGAAVAENQQWANVIAAVHGVDKTVAARYRTRQACIATIDPATKSLTGVAKHEAMIANGQRLNWIDAAPAAYLIKGIHFAGSGVQAKAGTVTLSQLGDTDITVPLPFLADVVFLSSTGAVAEEFADDALFTFGIVLKDGTQYRRAWQIESGLGTTAPRVSPSNIVVGQFRGGDVVDGPKTSLWASGFAPNGFKLRGTPNGIRSEVNYLALSLGGARVYLSEILTPTTNTIRPHSEIDFHAQLILELLSLVDLPDTDPDNFQSGTLGFYAMGGSGQWSTIASDRRGVNTSDNQGLSTTGMAVPNHDGSALIAATTAFGTDEIGVGVTKTYTGVHPTIETRQVILAVEAGTVDIGALLANFEASATEGLAPLETSFVNLSDVSAGSGVTYLWEMGDGTTYTTEHVPSHIYTTPGVYSVTLTVTSTSPATSDTITKENLITVVDIVEEEPGYVDELESGTVTPHTPNKRYDNDPTDPNYPTHTHAWHQDVVYFDTTPEGSIPHKAGKSYAKWVGNFENTGHKHFEVNTSGAQARIIPALTLRQMWYNTGNHSLIWQEPGGGFYRVIGEVYVPAAGEIPDPTGGGGEEGDDPVTIIQTISNGMYDDIQLADNTVTLSNSSALNLTGQNRWGILYFTGIAIPAGRVAQSVELTLYGHVADRSSPGGMVLHFQNSGTPAAPSTTLSDISGRSRTTGVVWNGIGLGAGSHVSPNLASALQQVLNIGGRPTTLNLALIIDCVADTDFPCRPAEAGPAQAPTLKIVHVAP